MSSPPDRPPHSPPHSPLGSTARALSEFSRQSALAAAWLGALAESEWSAPSVLDGWDVRLLAAHLVMIRSGLLDMPASRGDGPALAMGEFVRRYRPSADDIATRTRAVADGRSAAGLVAELSQPVDAAEALGVGDRTVLERARGTITARDWIATRILDLVTHCDDLSRSLPDREPIELARPALATAVRALAAILVGQAPGRSVEVRVPPFVAVQVIAGPRHTRGTPPNVVEADAVTWLRLATGRASFDAEVASGAIVARGNRANLAPYLPVLS